MQIDWLTVGAQVVNFLVLVYLLQRFLYGPIVRAMDRREAEIAERLRTAAEREATAQAEAAAYRERRREVEADREHHLADARLEAERLQARLAEEARRQVEATRRRWEDELEGEREAFFRDVRRQAAEQFIGLARRALGDLANAELEVQVAEALLARLAELDEAGRRAMAISARAAGNTVTVESAFELSAALRGRITRRLHEVIDPDLTVGYGRSEELNCGIQLKVGSQTLLWSLDSYLDGFERALAETLTAPGARPEGDA